MKAPLREALFELAATPGDDQWTPEAASRVFSKFPSFADEEKSTDFSIVFQGTPDGPIAMPVTPLWRVKRWADNKQRLIQLVANMCVYNVLGPAYEHFENETQTLSDVIDAYVETARPTKIGWIGQRYINAVRVPTPDVASYFTIFPTLPEHESHRPFALQVQLVEDKNSTVVTNLSLEHAAGSEANYVLDIYARSVGEPPIDVSAIKQWHSATHEHVRRVFSMTTTPKLRALFPDASWGS